MAEPLLDDETLVVRVHRHWMLVVRMLVVPLLVLAAVLAACVVLSSALPGEVRLGAILAGVALLGLWTIGAYARWASTALSVTNRRVILESGIVSRVTKVVALDRVQDVTTRQPPFGRLFGYGTVTISTAGAGGTELADHVPFPQRVRDEIFVQAGRQRQVPAT